MASKNLEPLKKHQESALSRLDANGGSLLICHPMGSGKTRTSVEAVEKLRKEGKIGARVFKKKVEVQQVAE